MVESINNAIIKVASSIAVLYTGRKQHITSIAI